MAKYKNEEISFIVNQMVLLGRNLLNGITKILISQ